MTSVGSQRHSKQKKSSINALITYSLNFQVQDMQVWVDWLYSRYGNDETLVCTNV